MAGWTGLEPAASAVTGRRYNQLNYHPARVSKYTLCLRETGYCREILALSIGEWPETRFFFIVDEAQDLETIILFAQEKKPPATTTKTHHFFCAPPWRISYGDLPIAEERLSYAYSYK